MLVDLVNPVLDPISALIAAARGSDVGVIHLRQGCYEIGAFDMDHVVEGATGRRPTFEECYADDLPVEASFGVCDSPEQFFADVLPALKADARAFVIGFTHITKDVANAGNGGGWRWHKWGPYIGHGTPTCEYLDDEAEFDAGVYVYQIIDVTPWWSEEQDTCDCDH
jgi:hypothetical protein